ncbi:MAG: SBBP repeat-containing protein, partial [Methanoregulaceae archaeon]|nr:SBBP repeat-containing protein [Methanoregulaceae archaeon]
MISEPNTAPDISEVLGKVPLPFDDPGTAGTVPVATPEDQESLTSSKPLFFIENQGQSSGEVLFEVISDGGIVFFTGDGAIIRVIRSVNDELISSRIGFTYEGASGASAVKGLEPLPCSINFMRGDPSRWITGVRTYRAISYPDLYPGIDLVYEGRPEGIKSIFRAKPGSNPESVITVYNGHEDLTINPDGALLIRTNAGTLTQSAPYCYQEIEGKEVRIPAAFILLSEDRVGFRFGEYDREKDLIIDPVIRYSLYLRGVGFADSNGVAVDSQRNVYVTGISFPAPFDANGTLSGGTDAVVVKINTEGTFPDYITYIGGNRDDTGSSICVDPDGYAYITGSTNSTDFPVIHAIQSVNAGQNDAFAIKLNRNGTALVYATYIGGTGQDDGYGIAIDSARNAYIAGSTSSKVFPLNHGPQNTTHAGNSDAFIVKINTNGTQFLYSEYIGGLLYENGYGIAVDTSGNAYITGETNSRNFPVRNAFQPSFGGYSDAFITKVAPDGRSFIFSTYLGGSGQDAARAIAVDKEGFVHVTGLTRSDNFPVQSAFIPTNPGLITSFYTRLQPDGSALSLSTYLTGPGFDEGRGVAVDSSGNAYITGITKARNLHTINAFQPEIGGGVSDAFVAKFVPGQSTPEFLSYLGGDGKDEGHAIAIDNLCGVYITGLTKSTDFPTTNPYPPTFLPRDIGGFITVLRDGDCCAAPSADFTFVLPNCTEILTVRFTDSSTNLPDNWSWQFGDGTTSVQQNPVHTYTSPGSYRVNLTVRKTCINATVLNSTISKQFTVSLNSSPVADFTANPSSGTAPLTVRFNDTSSNNPFNWSWQFGDGSLSSEQDPLHTYTSPGTYSVNLTVRNECGSDSVTKQVNVTVCPLPVADFTANPSSGTAPLTVWFNDTSSNNPFNWSWQFGDSGLSSEQNPLHTYTSPGTYSVNLTVRNECGND